MAVLQEKWLDDEDNFEKWESHLTAGQRRVLLTCWYGEAYKEFREQETLIKRSFEKTGCSLDLSGNLEKLNIEGLSSEELVGKIFLKSIKLSYIFRGRSLRLFLNQKKGKIIYFLMMMFPFLILKKQTI